MYMGHDHGAMRKSSHATVPSPTVTGVKSQKSYMYAPVSLPCILQPSHDIVTEVDSDLGGECEWAIRASDKINSLA